MKNAAEQAKRELSNCKAVELQIPLGSRREGNKTVAKLRLDQRILEKLAARVIEKVIETIQQALGTKKPRRS